MLLKFCSLLVVAILACTSVAQVQLPGLSLPPSAAANRDHITAMFNNSYSAYRQFAFGHDDLQPVSKSFNDGRNGWGASIIDGMDTAFIMGFNDYFSEAVQFVDSVNFNSSQTTVSVFETTIRYVGGLLSSYELSGQKYPILVQKAKEVVDRMRSAWVNENNIPYGHIDFSTDQPVVQGTNIAEAGTLTMEWSLLSKYTNSDVYRNLTERAVRQIISLPDPLPGLAPQCIDPATGQFNCAYITWGGGSDSYFEYLLKYALLSGTTDSIFIDTWRAAVDSSIKFLKRTSTVGNHVYLADRDDNGNIRHVGSHLACFHGGNWLLGGKLLKNDTIVQEGLQLVDACLNTYTSTATGIGPETFAYISSDGNYTGGSGPTDQQQQFYEKSGFYATMSDYVLRPEVLESNFYAWRITGDVKYFNFAAAVADNMDMYLKINNAYSGITDVTVSNSGRIDDMESFFLAETLKYLYLTFDDPSRTSLDKYVFNTECHPFEYNGIPSTFNSKPVTPTNTQPFTLTSPTTAHPAVSPNPLLPTPISDLIRNL